MNATEGTLEVVVVRRCGELLILEVHAVKQRAARCRLRAWKYVRAALAAVQAAMLVNRNLDFELQFDLGRDVFAVSHV